MTGKVTGEPTARILDPIYINTERHEYQRPHKRDDDDYNKWRQSLPDHCWECHYFQHCYPANKCTHNPRNPR